MSHEIELTDPRFARLLELAGERRLIVQIVLTMDDRRMQHPLLRVPHVDTAPLPKLLKALPGLRIVVLNAFQSLKPNQAAVLASDLGVYFEIAMLEGVVRVEKLLQFFPLDRLLFGSHFPLFAFESALGKLRESALGHAITKAVCVDNARRLMSD